MKHLIHRTRESLGGATALLLAAFVLLLGLPALAGPRALHGDGEGTPSEGSNQRGAELSAGDDELVGTLPIFDPDSGMPVPDDPDEDGEDDDGDDGDDDDGTPPNPGGGGLLTPPLPPVVGAPKLYLYGPYHLLGPCRAAIEGAESEIHFDPVNAGNVFLVVEGSAELAVTEGLFTIDGVEAGVLIGTDETSPVVGTVGYLGHYSRPFPMARGSKKVFPIAALAEYGYLADTVSLHTRSTDNGHAKLSVKSGGGDVTLSMLQF